MTLDTTYKSGKREGDENFPVASRLIAPRFRTPILAFYRFARAADDAADHTALDAARKLAILNSLEDTLLGKSDEAGDALPLRAALKSRNLSPQHALDLLKAFRQDVTKTRYATWAELVDYCRYSAMPVGRFVLDVHGEPKSTWPSSDALCTALQIINHLQDCGKDYRNLDRVYVPLEELEKRGLDVSQLGAERATPRLLDCLHDLASRTAKLLSEAELLPQVVGDLRLSVETSVIVEIARTLLGVLERRDPLAGSVHLSKSYTGLIAACATAKALVVRAHGKRAPYQVVKDDAA